MQLPAGASSAVEHLDNNRTVHKEGVSSNPERGAAQHLSEMSSGSRGIPRDGFERLKTSLESLIGGTWRVPAVRLWVANIMMVQYDQRFYHFSSL
jgi:hypothetical protein